MPSYLPQENQGASLFILHASVSIIHECLCKTVNSEAHCAVNAWIISQAGKWLYRSSVDLSGSTAAMAPIDTVRHGFAE